MLSALGTCCLSRPDRLLFVRMIACLTLSAIVSPRGSPSAAVFPSGLAAAPQSTSVAPSQTRRLSAEDIGELFKKGEASLREGKLGAAEASFKQVLAADPSAVGAYANLGVIAMRRQNWPQALTMLNQAEKLAPQVAGIRLNIGLVYYRQNDFQSATPPFESVVRDQPDSVQAKYLLGLC